MMIRRVACTLGTALAATLYSSVAVAATIPLALWDFEDQSGAPIAAGSTASRVLNGSNASAGADVAATGLASDDIAGFGGMDPFTIFATFQVDFSNDNSDANNTIFGYSPSGGGTAGADIRLYAQKDGQVRVEASAGAGSEVTLGAVNVYDGLPHTIALIVSGGEHFNDIDIYLDGTVYTNPLSAGNNAAMNIGTGGEIFIGKGGNLPPRYFGGLIDDVAIFGSALSLAELNDLRANGVPAPVPEPTALALLGLGAAAFPFRRRKG